MTSIEFKYDFKAGIHLSGKLWFNHFMLELKLFPNSDNEMDHNIAFERMNYVINDIVSHSVFVSEDDPTSILKLVNADIPVLTVPDPGPLDQVLQFVLTAKLSAVMEETFYIGESKISSEIGNGVTYVYNYDEEDEEEETRTSIVSDSALKWWNAAEPRFVTLSTEQEVEDFEPNLSWEAMELEWYGEDVVDVVLDEDTPDNGSNIMPFKPIKNDS